jgi:surfeit locus 1 family protein
VFRPLWWPTLLALPALGVLLALGLWQLDRLAAKERLIATAGERTRMAAVGLPEPASWAGLELEEWVYRPVTAEGVFEHDAEAYIYTVLSDPRGDLGGAGYLVMTPLRLPQGAAVLVNRGFVPDALKEPSTRSQGRPGWFAPKPDVDANVWYSRDILAIGAARGLAEPAPFYIDEGPREGVPVPQGGETRVSFPNPHLGYALTWFGLAGALVVVYLAFHYAQGRFGRAR